jgi:hypothetical protein
MEKDNSEEGGLMTSRICYEEEKMATDYPVVRLEDVAPEPVSEDNG